MLGALICYKHTESPLSEIIESDGFNLALFLFTSQNGPTPQVINSECCLSQLCVSVAHAVLTVLNAGSLLAPFAHQEGSSQCCLQHWSCLSTCFSWVCTRTDEVAVPALVCAVTELFQASHTLCNFAASAGLSERWIRTSKFGQLLSLQCLTLKHFSVVCSPALAWSWCLKF